MNYDSKQLAAVGTWACLVYQTLSAPAAPRPDFNLIEGPTKPTQSVVVQAENPAVLAAERKYQAWHKQMVSVDGQRGVIAFGQTAAKNAEWLDYCQTQQLSFFAFPTTERGQGVRKVESKGGRLRLWSLPQTAEPRILARSDSLSSFPEKNRPEGGWVLRLPRRPDSQSAQPLPVYAPFSYPIYPANSLPFPVWRGSYPTCVGGNCP